MGCAPSGPSYTKGGTRLMATKLAFTKGQLHNLNAYFRKLLDEAPNGECLTRILSINLARRFDSPLGGKIAPREQPGDIECKNQYRASASRSSVFYRANRLPFYRFHERFRDRSHRGRIGATFDAGCGQSRSEIFIRVPRFFERAPTDQGNGERKREPRRNRNDPPISTSFENIQRDIRPRLASPSLFLFTFFSLSFSLLSDSGSSTCCE